MWSRGDGPWDYELCASKNHKIPLCLMSHRLFVDGAQGTKLHDSKPLLHAAIPCAAELLIYQRFFRLPKPLSSPVPPVPGIYHQHLRITISIRKSLYMKNSVSAQQTP